MDVHLNLLRSHFALQAITFDMSALWMSPAAEEPVWLGVVYVFLEYFLTLPPPFPSRRYRRLSPACQRCPFALSHRQTHANHIPFYTPFFSCLLAAYEFFSTCLVFNRFSSETVECRAQGHERLGGLTLPGLTMMMMIRQISYNRSRPLLLPLTSATLGAVE